MKQALHKVNVARNASLRTGFSLGLQHAHKYADYYETCRRKRNTIDYTFSNVATETEAKEILAQASQFYGEVEGWIAKIPSSLKK